MLFGNWKITEDSIIWNGDESQQFVIPAAHLNITIVDFTSNVTCYETILLATNEDWLTQNDLYDLNYAFVYAIAKFGLDFNYDIFDTTLAQQYEQFEREDEDDV
ncbi:MAG: hypothetical protein WKF91_02975 [Segetibacter sp.]